jgi:hypothetical protein
MTTKNYVKTEDQDLGLWKTLVWVSFIWRISDRMKCGTCKISQTLQEEDASYRKILGPFKRRRYRTWMKF